MDVEDDGSSDESGRQAWTTPKAGDSETGPSRLHTLLTLGKTRPR